MGRSSLKLPQLIGSFFPCSCITEISTLWLAVGWALHLATRDYSQILCNLDHRLFKHGSLPPQGQQQNLFHISNF